MKDTITVQRAHFTRPMTVAGTKYVFTVTGELLDNGWFRCGEHGRVYPPHLIEEIHEFTYEITRGGAGADRSAGQEDTSGASAESQGESETGRDEVPVRRAKKVRRKRKKVSTRMHKPAGGEKHGAGVRSKPDTPEEA